MQVRPEQGEVTSQSPPTQNSDTRPRHSTYFQILRTALNDIQCHFPATMKSPPQNHLSLVNPVQSQTTGPCDWPKAQLILQSPPKDPENTLQPHKPTDHPMTPFFLLGFKKKKKKDCYENSSNPKKYGRQLKGNVSFSLQRIT